MGAGVGDRTESIASSWEGLRSHYEAPEQEQVYGLMVPAADSGRELRAVFEAMAGHLDTYACVLAGIKQRLNEFEERASAFRARVVGGVWVNALTARSTGLGDLAKGALKVTGQVL